MNLLHDMSLVVLVLFIHFGGEKFVMIITLFISNSGGAFINFGGRDL
jgi:hypothetical protein